MTKSSQRGHTDWSGLFGLAGIVLVIAAAYGWFANLFAVAALITHSAPVTTLFIGRVVGVFFAPLGVILGYF